jgi:hypothetical protein
MLSPKVKVGPVTGIPEFTYDSDSNPDMRGDFDDDSTKTESFESLSDREGEIWFIKWLELPPH